MQIYTEYGINTLHTLVTSPSPDGSTYIQVQKAISQRTSTDVCYIICGIHYVHFLAWNILSIPGIDTMYMYYTYSVICSRRVGRNITAKSDLSYEWV